MRIFIHSASGFLSMAQETVFCSVCGHNNLAGGIFCQKCGAHLAGIIAQMIPTVPVLVVSSPYGGFWIRVLAYIVDRIVVGVMFAPLALYFVFRMIADMHHLPPNDPEQLRPIFQFVGIVAPLGLIVQWLYEALLVSSSWQATVGKRVLDLKITDEDGNPLSFEHATGRFFAKVLSGIILGIGFLMVAFSSRKQGLHDMIAGTLVIKS